MNRMHRDELGRITVVSVEDDEPVVPPVEPEVIEGDSVEVDLDEED